jgi:hypothetical protein
VPDACWDAVAGPGATVGLDATDRRRGDPEVPEVEVASREAIVNRLAQDLGLPVVLEDAAQQLIAYSPHHDLTDRIRRDTILSQATAQEVVDHFAPYDLPAREEPFVVPGDAAADILPRLCIPLRHHDVVLGYAWVLLAEESVSTAQRAAAERARDALVQSLLAESRVRAGETEAVLNLLAGDPELRSLGLADLEARATFPRGRPCTVLVCVGPRWADPAVRTGFWTAAWAATPVEQLRAVTPREGVAVVVPPGPAAEHRRLLEAALARVLRAGRGGEGDLVVGVGSRVDGPGQAHRAHREARMAARAARASGGGRVALWDELGVDRVLAQLPHEALAEAVDPRVRRLAEEAPELAETLERYLAAAGAVAPVAAALHIHRTTLYDRLERVGRYGLDPARGEDRLTAHAGLRALRLLGTWPPA